MLTRKGRCLGPTAKSPQRGGKREQEVQLGTGDRNLIPDKPVQVGQAGIDRFREAGTLRRFQCSHEPVGSLWVYQGAEPGTSAGVVGELNKVRELLPQPFTRLPGRGGRTSIPFRTGRTLLPWFIRVRPFHG